jgi:molybdopterin synthase catalytic subunit
MHVRVRLFAILRERAGTDSLELELENGATAGDALARLAEEARLGDALARLAVVVARNREYVSADAPLADGDELALIPPVSGGEDGPHVRVTGERLDASALARRVVRPAAGAVVTFTGMTRDIPALEYEAYAEMAEERMRLIVADAVRRHSLAAAAAEHRVGAVPLSEPSVVVAVAAGHRAEAFAGAREIIDRIKAEAPIWKRGEDWAEGSPPPIS